MWFEDVYVQTITYQFWDSVMYLRTDMVENLYLDMNLFVWIHDRMAKVVVTASTKH